MPSCGAWRRSPRCRRPGRRRARSQARGWSRSRPGRRRGASPSPAQGYAGGPAGAPAESTIWAGQNRAYGRWAGGQTSPMLSSMTIAPLIIETRGLTKRFGRRAAVADVDLRVPAGCTFGFLGHNGAGKTTVIRMLVGLTKPDAGTITIAGLPLGAGRQDVLARVGAVIEEPRFHNHLTGRENLRVITAARGPRSRRLGEA